MDAHPGTWQVSDSEKGKKVLPVAVLLVQVKQVTIPANSSVQLD